MIHLDINGDSLNIHEESKNNSENNQNLVEIAQMYPISMMQLFIYLFIPIVKNLDESDFSNLKLVNGLKLWEPLWRHFQPDIPLFNSPVNFRVHKTNINASNKLTLVNENSENQKSESDENQLNEKISFINSNQELISVLNSSCNVFENLKHTEKRISQIENNHSSFSCVTSDSDESKDYENKYGNSINLSNLLLKTLGDDTITDAEDSSRKAPLAHMSSVCSFSELPVQNESPVMFSVQESLPEYLPTLHEQDSIGNMRRSSIQLLVRSSMFSLFL